MKRLNRFLLIAGLLLLPLWANATIIGNTNLTLQATAPSGYVTIGSLTNVYFDYDAKLTGDTSFREAFCVENANAVNNSTNAYTLLKVDSGLSAYGLDPARYLKAVAIANYFFNNYESLSESFEDPFKAGAQIAIWEVMFETAGTFDLGAGYFKAANGYTSYAQAIWNAVKDQPALTSTDEWVLAVNPTVKEGQTIGVAPAQNYLVKYKVPVPEPASLLLFGLGLLGLAGVSRKLKK